MFDGGFAFGRVAGQAELPMVIGPKARAPTSSRPSHLRDTCIKATATRTSCSATRSRPTPAALPHECVGQLLPVPEFLTLFPGEANPNYSPGATWNKCDMKAVPLVPGLNAAPNFFMFTEAPVAGHGVGFILDDTATEFNYLAPNFGEKYSPPHLPVSVRDWTDREITRVYSDQFGSYNFLLPSSFTVNPPYPSGVMPSMMVACMNHPGRSRSRSNTTSDQAGHRSVLQPQLHDVLLHVPVPGGQDDLPRHAGVAGVGVRVGHDEPARLRVRGRHAAYL